MPYFGYICDSCADTVPDSVDCEYEPDAVGHRCLMCSQVITERSEGEVKCNPEVCGNNGDDGSPIGFCAHCPQFSDGTR